MCTKTAPNLRKCIIFEKYFEESNINLEPLISSQDMIIKKFGQKKKDEFGFWEKRIKTAKNLRNSVIL